MRQRKPSFVVERITPARARQYYNTSRLPNRKINHNTVTAYAILAKAGQWQPYPPIAFDYDGRLWDGHHRMLAVEQGGVPVHMLVARNVNGEAQKVIDTGRPRSLSQQLDMFRPRIQYKTMHVANINVCATLLIGHAVPLKTLYDYDRWMEVFGRGVEWSVRAMSGSPMVRLAPVSGALAFVYAIHQQKVMEFGQMLVAQEELPACHPALMLIKRLQRLHPGEHRSGSARKMQLMCEVLNYLRAHIHGSRILRVDCDDAGKQFFRKAYESSEKARELIAPWAPAKVLAVASGLRDVAKGA